MSRSAGQTAQPTPWSARLVALGVDVVPGALVAAALALTALSLPVRGVGWWGCVLLGAGVILATAVNRVMLPLITGWSLGRAVCGIEVRGGGGKRPTERTRRIAALVFGAAAAVSVAAALTGYLAVYRQEHGADRVREQITRQGPKIVADMLSYDPASLAQDFDRAQSLATAKYREQLVPQQEAISRGTPAANYYRVTDAAVLDAAPHRATMLLFLQGQRGAAGKEQLISATVRVVFAGSGRQWRVDDLTVVSKPDTAEEVK